MAFSIGTRLCTGALLIVLVSACATAPQTQNLIQNPPLEISSRSEIVDVPFFPQTEYQCGPAALATVANHNDIEVSPQELVAQVYIPARKGSLQIEMVAAARNLGLLGYRLKPELKNILLEIDHGNPVLVFQNLALQAFPKWHYAVAVGYDLQQSELILRSGTYRRHRVDFSTFEKTWQRADFWAFVFTPVGQIPYTATPLEHLKASHELQETRGEDFSIDAFRSGVERWPENSLMLVSVANVEFSAGNWDKAIQYLQREIQHRPQNSTAWNNLAYALLAADCKDKAMFAVQCALKLDPESDNIRHSLEQIQATPTQGTDTCDLPSCPMVSFY